MTDTLALAAATPRDLPAVAALLGASGLPFADLDPDRLAGFTTARERGRLVGVIGLETYGVWGLLRSLAVAERARGTGLGGRLVAAVEETARACGLVRLVLLTETAAPFFTARGYTSTDRADVPEAVRRSSEFAALCPASAVCLTKTLTPMTALDTLPLDDPDAVRASVREKYAAVALGGDFGASTSCCGPGGCGTPADLAAGITFIGDDYAAVDGYVAGADLGLGCGVPTDLAELAPGQTVLDLGSGAGIDAFVARQIVGETGRVLGVDMTPEMVAKARANARQMGYANVEFRLGEIEALPVDAGTVDVVISNCVLNLVPDKGAAFAETFRVLRPGGHFCVSDVVTRGVLPDAVRRSAELYAGCVAGAVDEAEYVGGLAAAGFEGVEVRTAREVAVPDAALSGVLDAAGIAALRASGAGVWSVTVFGRKPAGPAAP